MLPDALAPDEVWNQIRDGFCKDVSNIVVYSTTDNPDESFLERLFVESAAMQSTKTQDKSNNNQTTNNVL